MTIKINKKGDTGPIFEKVLAVILVLIVIIVILLFLFRADIKEYLRNLPGYQASTEDKEVVIPDSDLEGMSKLCPNKVGEMDKGNDMHIWINGVNTPFYLSNDKWFVSGTFDDLLFLKYDQSGRDKIVGTLSVYKTVKLIKISDFDVKESDKNYLNQLDRAFIFSGRQTEICRYKQ